MTHRSRCLVLLAALCLTLALAPGLHAAHGPSGSTTCNTLTLMPGALPAPAGTLSDSCPGRVSAPSGTASFRVTYSVLAWNVLEVDVYPRVGFDANGAPVHADTPLPNASCTAVRALNDSFTDCDGPLALPPGFGGLVDARLDGDALGHWGWVWSYP